MATVTGPVARIAGTSHRAATYSINHTSAVARGGAVSGADVCLIVPSTRGNGSMRASADPHANELHCLHSEVTCVVSVS